MSVETWINLVAVAGSAVALYFMLRRPVDKLETEMRGRFDKLETEMWGRFDKLENEFTELRIEMTGTHARHDERIAAIEKQRPTLTTR